MGYKLKQRMEAYVSLSYTHVFLLDFPRSNVIKSKESILQCVDVGLKVKGASLVGTQISANSCLIDSIPHQRLGEDHPVFVF